MKLTGPLALTIALALIAYEKQGSALFLSSRAQASEPAVVTKVESPTPTPTPAKAPNKRSKRKSH